MHHQNTNNQRKKNFALLDFSCIFGGFVASPPAAIAPSALSARAYGAQSERLRRSNTACAHGVHPYIADALHAVAVAATTSSLL